MKFSRLHSVFPVCLIALLGLSACSTSTKNAENDSNSTSTALQVEGESAQTESEASEQEQTQTFGRVTERPSQVPKRGGYIRVLVNSAPITNLDINHRMKLLQLQRAPGDRRQKAEKELIDQAIKLAEAKRQRSVASDQQVEQAFENFARQNRVSKTQLARELGRMGVGAPHFKEFIRTQISWQTIVQRRFQAETAQKSEVDVITGLRKSGSEKPELAEYHFQQVVFVIPEDKRKALLNTRKKEATAFRQRFSSCDQTVDAAKALRDVTVVERRRIMEPELPQGWRDEIAGIQPGGTTKVKETPNGVEFIAICDMKMVSDDRAAQVASQAAQFENFGASGGEIAEGYLQELRSRASIVYR